MHQEITLELIWFTDRLLILYHNYSIPQTYISVFKTCLLIRRWNLLLNFVFTFYLILMFDNVWVINVYCLRVKTRTRLYLLIKNYLLFVCFINFHNWSQLRFSQINTRLKTIYNTALQQWPVSRYTYVGTICIFTMHFNWKRKYSTWLAIRRTY